MDMCHVSVIQPAHPCQQKTLYELLLYQIVNGHVNFAHCTTKPVSEIPLRYTGPLKASNMYECLSSFFPAYIALQNSLPQHVYKTVSHCILLNRLYFVTHLMPHLTLNP